MKINRKQEPSLVSGVSQVQKSAPGVAQKQLGAKDRLEFSIAGRRMVPAGDEATAQEIRAARIAEIREQIDAGTYDVNAKRIAQALITGNIVDEVV